MASSESESRRQFLKGLALLLSCQYSGARVFADDKISAESSSEAKAAKYKLAPWTGDDFTMGHKLRVNDLPPFPDKAEKKVDFIIVGGGVAGLTAAFNLKDHDFLLLEQYADFGGNSRGSSYQGIGYTYGAAYVGPVEGIYGELYSALGLEPIELPPERNEFYSSGEWIVGVEGNRNKPLYKEFARLLDESRPIWKGIPAEPGSQDFASADMQKLDSAQFSASLSGYSKEFMAVLDSFCRSSFGGGVEQLSALAGYAILQDLVTVTHMFKGGNPAITNALMSKIASAGDKRCQSNAFVWKIELSETGASVVYSLADGSTHRVDCKHVIVATPPLVAARQLVHVPDMVKAQLLMFKFCSYLVANMLMKEKLFKGKYDNFVSEPFSFTDFTVAETPYLLTNSYKPQMGSVLTVYQPYANGTGGRTAFMTQEREKFASSLASQMEKIVPGFENSVDAIVLTRWGHALAIVGPRYFERLGKLQALQTNGPYSLAHSTIYGWPAAESAILAGTTAAQRARTFVASPGTIVK